LNPVTVGRPLAATPWWSRFSTITPERTTPMPPPTPRIAERGRSARDLLARELVADDPEGEREDAAGDALDEAGGDLQGERRGQRRDRGAGGRRARGRRGLGWVRSPLSAWMAR
jgi:hypothetical protein